MVHRWEMFCEREKKSTRYSITFQTQVIKGRSLAPGTSSQKTKLTALTPKFLSAGQGRPYIFTQISSMHIPSPHTHSWDYLEGKRYAYSEE